MVVGLALNISEMAADSRLAIEFALLAVTILVATLVAGPLLKNVWRSVRELDLTFELLFVTGILGAVGVSVASMIRGTGPIYFEVASLLMVIYALGDRVGAVSKQRSLDAARAWLETNPTCRIETPDGEHREVALSEVRVGQIAVVFAGEEIPVDGRVRHGRAYLRTSQVTGESRPIVVRPGDHVLAGSHVVDASLRIEVEATAGDRSIDSIARRVERAWGRPSTWQTTANRLVRYFFPIVATISVATFIGWTYAASWEAGLMNALAVLLVACPCAMGFAIPLAIWMTLGTYARRGLVGHSGDVVERLAEVDTVIFDKTGTLTADSEHLTDVVVDPDHDRRQVLGAAAALEATSSHPVARAFQDSELMPGGDRFTVFESSYVAGRGIRGTVRDRDSGVESSVFIGELSPDDIAHLVGHMVDRPSARKLGICVDGTTVAAALVDEHPVDGSADIESVLAALDVDTVLLTGDTSDRAARVGISAHYANLSPSEKARFVDKLQADGARVCFVGDGINDAGAMASAHVSIAHESGSDLTVDVADMTWHGRRPELIPRAIESARQSVTLIRHNLYYAAGYNLLGMTAAAAGVLHPVAAAVIMVASSLFVTWRTVWALDPTAATTDSQQPRPPRVGGRARPVGAV
jgi:heavy metal translocating P-type ATPase